MLKMNTKQEVIIRYYRQGQSQRQISRDLGIHRRTVKKYLDNYAALKKGDSGAFPSPSGGLHGSILEAPKYNSTNRKKRKLTQEIVEQIDIYLKKNEDKRTSGQSKQVLKKIDIWEALKVSGYQISYSTVCNYIRGQSGSKEAYIRQQYQPGAVCEFDWGEVKLWIGGKLRVYQLAVFTLAWSNYRYAILYARQDSQSFQQSHVSFFAHLGGVPQQMVYDNMRVAVKRFVGRTEKQATDGLLGMSMYYQYAFRFCNVGKGNEKGHVERSVEYVRRKAFGLVDEFDDLSLANKHLFSILDKLNGKVQQQKGQSAMSLLQSAIPCLGQSPSVVMECAEWKTYRVDKYSTICIETNHYSVPEAFTLKMVEVKLYADRLEIYYNQQALWAHQRRQSQHKWYLYLGHYLDTLKRKPGALKGSVALDQADTALKRIYANYFQDTPRQFIELLHYQRQKGLTCLQIQAAINKLLKLGTKDISLDKIKVTMEHAPQQDQLVKEGEIEHLAKAQLKDLADLLNQN